MVLGPHFVFFRFLDLWHPVWERFVWALLLLSLTPALFGQADPATAGQWGPVFDLVHRPVHAHLLPTGKVLYFSYYDESLQPKIWDPATGVVTDSAPSSYRLFCSGHSFLPSGELFVTSGHLTDYVGYKDASAYNPFSDSWSRLPAMNAGRWYPTNTTLANGDVLVVSGQIDTTVGNNPLPQVWQSATSSWRDLTSAQRKLPLYPFMFLAPNGNVFGAGPSQSTHYLDTSGAGTWSAVATSNCCERPYGSAAMYNYGKILIVGGGDPPTATAEIIDLSSASPIWKYTSPMKTPRRQHNATVLADGTVLVTGGSSGPGFDNPEAPVLTSELWDPATGEWTTLASLGAYRGYHSISLLLPDGRVLSGGGNHGGATGEIFSPPYLFKGARPVIGSAPSAMDYARSYSIGTAQGASIVKVSLVRLSSVTHSFNMDQRFAPLQFSVASGGIQITTPSSSNLAPPGYYMLFLINGAGVPSLATIVQLLKTGAVPASTGHLSGRVLSASGAALSGANVTVASGGSAITDGSGTYTLRDLPVGGATLTASASGYKPQTQDASVTAGSTTTVPDFQLQLSSGAGVLVGSVTNSANGKRIVGATVSYDGGSTTTNDIGSYRLVNVRAGTYQITAAATGYLSSMQSVTVIADATIEFDFSLSPGGRIRGTVVLKDGTPVVGASVEFRSAGLETVVTKLTNSNGVYNSGWIPTGNYTVTVSKTSYAQVQRTATVVAGSTTKMPKITLEPTAPQTTGSISGRVTNISTGAGLTVATITASFGSTTTDSLGDYNFATVAPGTYSLSASRNGYLDRTFSVTVNSGAVAEQDFPLATAGKISGTVTNSSGAGISGATVQITGGVISTTVTKTTSSTGEYSSGWIAVGDYTVTMSKAGLTTQTKQTTVTTGATSTVSVTLK